MAQWKTIISSEEMTQWRQYFQLRNSEIEAAGKPGGATQPGGTVETLAGPVVVT